MTKRGQGTADIVCGATIPQDNGYMTDANPYSAGAKDRQIESLTRTIEAQKATIENLESRLRLCVAAVPTTWLDDILTGPNAVIREQPWGCPEVERILSAVRKRIEKIAHPTDSTQAERSEAGSEGEA